MTLYSIDPLGASEGVGRTFYYQDFLKGVGKPGQVYVGDLSLQVLAIQSGGLALTSSNDVVSQLQKCLADTEAYYELSFDPAPADHRDEYHSLLVQVAKPWPDRTHPEATTRLTGRAPRVETDDPPEIRPNAAPAA